MKDEWLEKIIEKLDDIYSVVKPPSGIVTVTPNITWTSSDTSTINVSDSGGSITIDGNLFEKASWKVGAARDLPIAQRGSWDGSAAKARIFSWAGWPDNPQPSKARRAFLLYDASEPTLKGSYKDPFADVVNGKLVAISAGLRAAASRLPQTSVPEDVMGRARKVIDGYQSKMRKSGYMIEKSDSDGKIQKDIDVFVSEDEAQLRAAELEISGFHSLTIDGMAVFMPGLTHDEYLAAVSPEESMMDKSWEADLLVKSHEKQLVYGIVYPLFNDGEVDLQGDFARAEEIEKMAHGFMINFVHDLAKGIQTRGMDLDHMALVTIADALPVESFIAPADFELNGKEVRKGSWVMVTKVFKSELWDAIKNGQINAYSIRGLGKRKLIN